MHKKHISSLNFFISSGVFNSEWMFMEELANMSSDAELVARVCAHDTQAFEALSARYRDMIYRHVLAMLHDNNAAEDIVQEVFLRVWTHAAQWNGRGTFQAWLFRIATNLALNALRTTRRRRQQSLEIPDDPLDEDDESCMPSWMVDHSHPELDMILEQGERSKLFQQLVDRLPAEKRTVFRLVYDDEMQTRQIAETLGIPEGTVKSRLHYATRRLAQQWRDLQQEGEDLA
jgi:RNA polymerase sigma-70 factor (ECF subfamily)